MEAALGFGIFFIILILGGIIAINVFFLLNLMKLLQACAPENQRMGP